MKGKCRFEEVDLDRIDGSDKRFAFAFPVDVGDLLPSVEEAGILVPPFLQEQRAASYRIVCGHRRVEAARRAGIQRIPARIAGEDVGDLGLFLEAVRENTMTRPVNDIERGRSLERLVSVFGADPGILDEVMEHLGLSPGRRTLNRYCGLVRLIGDLQDYVVTHKIPIRVSSRFSAWPEEDQRILSRLLQKINFGGNALRNLLDLLEEIALREKKSIGEILERPEVTALRENKELTTTQIRERVQETLQRIRYPRLTEQNETLNNLLKKVRLKGVQWVPPPFLEGEAMEVRFRFGSVEELRERLASLGGLAERKEIGEILAFLQQVNASVSSIRRG